MSAERDYVFAETDDLLRCAHCDLLLHDSQAVRCETCGLLIGSGCTSGECPSAAAAPATSAER